MCGIYGILSLGNGSIPGREALKKMGALTRYRGPDDEGAYIGEGVALGMRRLAIIDVAGGQQPICNEDQTVWVVCNGEIYNFQELREELARKGHEFRTRSDTEVLVHLYEEEGEEFLQRVSGMYGVALWDTRRKRLFIGRDRLGIKPLYYYRDASRLIFASEAKAILTVPGVGVDMDPVALEQYLTLGYVPAPHSMFRGVKKLLPGSLMVCQGGEITTRRHWQLPMHWEKSPDVKDWGALVLDRLRSAVSSQMVSDVPLGAFLSGGIDSSAVVALMAEQSDRPVKTYSIGFDTGKAGSYYNELPFAQKISQLFGTEHKEIIVRPDVVGLLPRLIWHMDEPLADAAFITTFLVAEFARRDVTVILSGVGGDELFGGYRRYLGEHYLRQYRRLPQWVRRAIVQPLAGRLPSDRHSPLMNLSRYARSFLLSSERPFEERYKAYVQILGKAGLEGLLRQSPLDRFDALGEAFRAAAPGDSVDTLIQVDMMTQLPDDLLLLTDKMTMATSLECRVPLLDDAVVELAARMPSRVKVKGRELKNVLKQSLQGLLPKEILYRSKRGFGAPIGAWLKHELAPVVRLVLSKDSVERRGLFRWEAVKGAIDLHGANREDYTDHLLSLMNLELWCRIFLDGQSPSDLSEQLRGKGSA